MWIHCAGGNLYWSCCCVMVQLSNKVMQKLLLKSIFCVKEWNYRAETSVLVLLSTYEMTFWLAVTVCILEGPQCHSHSLRYRPKVKCQLLGFSTIRCTRFLQITLHSADTRLNTHRDYWITDLFHKSRIWNNILCTEWSKITHSVHTNCEGSSIWLHSER